MGPCPVQASERCACTRAAELPFRLSSTRGGRVDPPWRVRAVATTIGAWRTPLFLSWICKTASSSVARKGRNRCSPPSPRHDGGPCGRDPRHLRQGGFPGRLTGDQPRNRAFSAIAATRRLGEGGEATQIHPAVAPNPEDILVTKKRISAFVGSDLDVVLRSLEVDSLVMTGIATSGVVLSTLRQAADLDYQLTVLRDGARMSTRRCTVFCSTRCSHARLLFSTR